MIILANICSAGPLGETDFHALQDYDSSDRGSFSLRHIRLSIYFGILLLFSI